MKTQEKRQLEIIRYNILLSIIFFISSSFYFSFQVRNFSFNEYTISDLSEFLTQERLGYFNLTFIIKALLDLSFAFYLLKKYRLKFFSLTFFSLLISILCFGLLGFFPSAYYLTIHRILVYLMFFFFSLAEYFLARLTKNPDFQYLTKNLLFVQTTLIFLFLITTKEFNGVFEIVYMLLVFFWFWLFINRYMIK